MAWSQLEPTAPHLTYLTLSTFLITYALFSSLIRNLLHLSEPPLATLLGILLGPHGLSVLNPLSWGFEDDITLEATRVIIGVQVFAVGVELPRAYFARHWRSVAMMLGPVMLASWLLVALFARLVLATSVTTSLLVGACLAPTDPVLAASVLAESRFAKRVPRRLRHLLSAESGCNDGMSFPFLYVALYAVLRGTGVEAVRDWVLIGVLYQCVLGLGLGLVIGYGANRLLRFSDGREYIDSGSFFVFYFLLAVFTIGTASTLGLDDFLVAFGAGTGFAWDGWFASKTKATNLPEVLDLLLNSTMFIYFGAIIPWHAFTPTTLTPNLTPLRLLSLLVLVLLFRRIPIVLALKRFIPDLRSYREALFAGHFGPMGLGALFLAIEARAQLETGTSHPLPHPRKGGPNKVAIEMIWPVVAFVVLGSIMVHGLSVAGIAVGSHFSRGKRERGSLVIGGEEEPLYGMEHEESEPSVSGEDDPSADER